MQKQIPRPVTANDAGTRTGQPQILFAAKGWASPPKGYQTRINAILRSYMEAKTTLPDESCVVQRSIAARDPDVI